ncbi:MAG: nucleoside triphosphate pyrophosphohydrolase family protein [Clostridia bacterium]|nr:nucleoside triphosphate pyrophosphohydrolase family protein [Clostridia bacterium]
MRVDDYQREAMTLLNPALTQQDVLMNALMGLCGESGEAIDLMKKHLYQGHPLDREKLIRELGDVAWYLAEAATGLGVDLSAILQRNLDKLHARYPAGFDTNRSQHRAQEEGNG